MSPPSNTTQSLADREDTFGNTNRSWQTTVDRVMCHAVVSVTQVDAKLGNFQVRIICRWAFRTSSSNRETEVTYRGVPGIRIPGLSVKVQESRIWKDLSKIHDKSNTLTWNGTSIFLLEGYKPYNLKDFPFDRHIISLKHVDFVWRSHKDDDDFFDSMQIAWLDIDFKSILPEWRPHSRYIIALQKLGDDHQHDGQDTTICSKFQFDLHIERCHTFYVRQIFFVTYLITIASCAPLAMRPEDMGDRLSVYGGGLLTLVAFKYSVMDHLPSVPYSTFTDWFLLLQIVTLAGCTFESLIGWRFHGDYETYVDWVENFTFFAVCFLWTIAMIMVAFCKPRCRSSWDKVLEQDEKGDPLRPERELPHDFSHRDASNPDVLGKQLEP
ncbi:unnamed protein product [Effrenium voratum]|nr:unnamed protein product [Effrenium voratum]